MGVDVLSLAGTSQALPLPKERAGFELCFYFF